MRRDWRETVALAADVALVGILVTAAAVPLVTAGAALRTGSVAMRAIVAGDGVDRGTLWRVFKGSLLPGCAATGR